MKESDVEIILQRAREKFPDVSPGIISENAGMKNCIRPVKPGNKDGGQQKLSKNNGRYGLTVQVQRVKKQYPVKRR